MLNKEKPPETKKNARWIQEREKEKMDVDDVVAIGDGSNGLYVI